ncbi:hypothetical protein DFJ43DRAFT_423656 [Lentinula guzmanii]|uniref:Uncharacterized protein n=1 Tax=Lentinula guzmanii TaxID=2804957 RepID=A0AA38JHN6_9AGAR|nr:hypothetical protein DFJ43DRAFT_423656 [Lentinula guzmanii]
MSSYESKIFNLRLLTKAFCFICLLSMSLPPQTNARSLARALSLPATTATVACPVPQGTSTGSAQGTSNHKSTASSSGSQSQPDDARASASGGKTKERSARGYEADITGLDSNFTALITAPNQAKRAVGAAHGMKLWMMVCAKDVEQFAYTKPGLWVKIGGLDLTPSKPTAESWGINYTTMIDMEESVLYIRIHSQILSMKKL